MTKKTFTRREMARSNLKDILNFYPISESNAFKIARVTRSTWRRWLAGTANPPPATVELIRIMALGEPPAAGWDGFRFAGGFFYDDHGHEYTPGDLRALQLYKIHSIRYIALLKQIENERRAQNEKAAPQDGQKPMLRIVK